MTPLLLAARIVFVFRFQQVELTNCGASGAWPHVCISWEHIKADNV